MSHESSRTSLSVEVERAHAFSVEAIFVCSLLRASNRGAKTSKLCCEGFGSTLGQVFWRFVLGVGRRGPGIGVKGFGFDVSPTHLILITFQNAARARAGRCSSYPGKRQPPVLITLGTGLGTLTCCVLAKNTRNKRPICSSNEMGKYDQSRHPSTQSPKPTQTQPP